MMSSDERSKNSSQWKPIRASVMARNTHNPIRNIVDNMVLTPNPKKKMIALSIGDPTTFGNLPLCPEILDAVDDSLRSGLRHGYAPSVGYEDARDAVARHHSNLDVQLTAKDVILACGCSGAIDLALTALAGPGDNILIPSPGFPLYSVLAQSALVECKYYKLIPELSWEADLQHLESLIDNKTTLIVVNNPSNPCGSVWNSSHISDIIKLAEKYHLPIVADEVYADFVFDTERFVSFASLSTQVPILTCGGLTKKYLVPGWRCGWILIHDPLKLFDLEVRKGLTSLSQKLLGPNTFVQGALKTILNKTPDCYFQTSIRVCQDNAKLCYEALKKVKGLHPIMPNGAMYMMVGIDIQHFPSFKSDVDFTEKLITEQSVFCLPATCFTCPNFFRIVLTVPEEIASEACERLVEFCSHHYREVDENNNNALIEEGGYVNGRRTNGETTCQDILKRTNADRIRSNVITSKN